MDTKRSLASQEVRWFLAGAVDDHAALKRWFETAAPIPKKGAFGPLEWRGRLGDEPDIYLIIPGADDIGIKWREGEFQIKGCVAALGAQVFAGRFQGKVERWMKWSYAKVPETYRQIFTGGAAKGMLMASVRKTRALRKVRLDTLKGTIEEVDPMASIDRGLSLELTNLELDGTAYCTVAFEAFPDDSGIGAAFAHAVETFLGVLEGVELTAANSWSYPAWLARVRK